MPPTLITAFLVLLSPVVILASQERASASKPLVLTHVNVIDTAGGPIQTGMTVVITNGRIAALGKFETTLIPAHAEVIDSTGKFLIPGLWDMHAHLGTDDFDRDAHLALFIINGVTGVRLMDGEPQYHLWRREIAKGVLNGPRLIIASPIIGQVAISAAEARQKVRRAKQSGADLVKVHDNLSRESYFAVIEEARRLKLRVTYRATDYRLVVLTSLPK